MNLHAPELVERDGVAVADVVQPLAENLQYHGRHFESLGTCARMTRSKIKSPSHPGVFLLSASQTRAFIQGPLKQGKNSHTLISNIFYC